MGRSQSNRHAFVKATEGSEVEGVFLPGFGDVGHKWPRDVGCDEAVATGEGLVGPELLLNPFVGGKLAQALGNLPVVLDREEP